MRPREGELYRAASPTSPFPCPCRGGSGVQWPRPSPYPRRKALQWLPGLGNGLGLGSWHLVSGTAAGPSWAEEEAFRCCLCLLLTPAQPFLICRWCSDQSAIKHPAHVRVSIGWCDAVVPWPAGSCPSSSRQPVIRVSWGLVDSRPRVGRWLLSLRGIQLEGFAPGACVWEQA